MNVEIVRFTKERLNDVIEFELELRRQEPNTYFWMIDDAYKKTILDSLEDERFMTSAISLLAYKNHKVVGRIDASIIYSHFDGRLHGAYLDWICILKNERHHKIAQELLKVLKQQLKKQGIEQLVLLTARNDEASRFYANCDDIHLDFGATIAIN